MALAGELTIGQLAGQFGLATHVLRHWEAVGLLAPASRVSGRRRYRREHLARVATILRGKEAGLSLDQVREMLDAPDPTSRRELLRRHHQALEERIAHIQAAKELVEHILDCPVEDFTQCPEFQRVVTAVATRVPFNNPPGHRWPRGASPGGEADDAFSPGD